jgi:hypothetical protein
VFTSELTYTFRILIPKNKFKKIMNLVIAQDSRTKDLYYSMKVFSNVNFNLKEAQSYKYQYEIPIEQVEGGGTPNHDSFIMNPQIFFEPKKHDVKNFNCWISYNVHGFETAVKVFLVKAEKPNRVEYITTSNQVEEEEESSPYYNKS